MFCSSAVESVLLGCVPVIIAEGDSPYLFPFEPFGLNWDDWAIKRSVADIPQLASILAWDESSGYRMLRKRRMEETWSRLLWARTLPARVRKLLHGPDAFETTMQVLQKVLA